MKKTLTCLLIILAVSLLSLTFVSPACSATSDIQILDNYTCYADSLGYLVVIGEVQNVGSSVIQNVALSASVTESDGTIGTSSCYVWGDYLLPGEKAPFYLEFYPQGSSSEPWNGVTTSQVTITVKSAPEATQYQYQGITIVSQIDTPTTTGEYWVTAELKNTGSETATDVMIIATFYNSEGLPISSGYITPIDISAGATETIKVPAFDLNQSVASSDKIIESWRLLVQVASPMQTDGNYPTVSTSPVSGSSSGSGSTSNSGTSTPAETDPNVLYAAVGAAALVIVVATVLMIKKKKKDNRYSGKTCKPDKTSKKKTITPTC